MIKVSLTGLELLWQVLAGKAIVHVACGVWGAPWRGVPMLGPTTWRSRITGAWGAKAAALKAGGRVWGQPLQARSGRRSGGMR